MVKQIIWSKKAKEDKTEILRYWLNRNKSNVYPKKLNDLIKEAILWIVENPFVRRNTDYEGVYVKQVRDYFILFEETESTIYILTIWDTRQDPKKIEDIINQK
ncbi:MAG: type II toxin-antitoxin system RelE/ParE family toxin [Saprospiraceae bacterium]|nr:type II toxin-antitoxin system RelE/ParE family toxin [Saprospiraceae bacterium]MBK8632434.1 type II toxin-antitoxin system RelE/ParE family toxin [Saprospiraceae bacterium]